MMGIEVVAAPVKLKELSEGAEITGLISLSPPIAPAAVAASALVAVVANCSPSLFFPTFPSTCFSSACGDII